MINRFLILLLIIPLATLAQDKFTYDQLGLSDYVVVKKDSLSTSELYRRTLNWIKDTYTNPSEVIKSEIENEKIRITGSANGVFTFYTLGIKNSFRTRYSLEFLFKKGKVKFDVTNLDYYQPSGQYVLSSGWKNISPLSIYKKKTGKIKKQFRDTPKDIEDYFNALVYSFDKFLNYSKVNEQKDDW